MRYYLLLPAFCLVNLFDAKSQCAAPLAEPTATCGTGTPLADGANIATGETHFFSGTNGMFSNISLSGGTLLICGSATITNVNFNSGKILVALGGSVVFNGNFNVGNNVSFYNEG